MKQAQAAARDLQTVQAEMAALQEWADEELYQRDCRIQELEGTSTATDVNMPPATPAQPQVSLPGRTLCGARICMSIRHFLVAAGT